MAACSGRFAYWTTRPIHIARPTRTSCCFVATSWNDLQTLARLSEELEDQRAHLRELFARVAESVVMLNRDLRILRVNPEFTNPKWTSERRIADADRGAFTPKSSSPLFAQRPHRQRQQKLRLAVALGNWVFNIPRCACFEPRWP